jgi:hypothetical protein
MGSLGKTRKRACDQGAPACDETCACCVSTTGMRVVRLELPWTALDCLGLAPRTALDWRLEAFGEQRES